VEIVCERSMIKSGERYRVTRSDNDDSHNDKLEVELRGHYA